jgi:peptidoglycan-N-acetylglucosamine deacetylase
VALAIALGIVAVVASATSNGPKRAAGSDARAAPRTPARAHRRAPQHARAHRPALAAAPAIDAVLRYTRFVSRGGTRRRVIALTFDDGPSPYTQPIVRVLLRMHAPATFFIVGQQLTDFAAGLRDEVAHGFEIGDHTENHAAMNRLSASGQLAQVRDAATRITRLGAPFPRLYRPPYGYYDATTFSILRGFHMLMVMWSIDPRDWIRPGTGAIVQRVLSAAIPGGIVELHDGGGDRSETLAALPAIINGLRRRHYQLVTIEQLLAHDPPPRHQPLPHPSGA